MRRALLESASVQRGLRRRLLTRTIHRCWLGILHLGRRRRAVRRAKRGSTRVDQEGLDEVARLRAADSGLRASWIELDSDRHI